jgi:putative FmdB family regulatory protein
MPTYEYACSSCHHEWEFEQSIKDSPLTECPSCHQATAKRQISRGTGFILKGSGWYADLYSSASNKPAEGKKDESSSKPSGSTGSGSGSSEGSGSGGSSSGSASGSSGSTPASSGSSTKSSAAAV